VPSSTLVRAVRATQAAGSYTLTLGGSVDVSGQGFPIEGGGAVDARRDAGHLTLDLRDALAESGSGMPRQEGRADAVWTGGVLYVRSPYLAHRRGIQRPWIRYGRGGAAAASGLLGYLRAVEEVRRQGFDTIDGVRTTHYSATIDFRRYAIGARPGEVGALNGLMRVTGASLPVEVWVDSADRIRRVQTQIGTSSYQAVPQVDVSGFGRPVVVRAPAPAQVAAPR
jgi:hypothetical protein